MMDQYRIVTMKYDEQVLQSPFVFTKEEAIRKCRFGNRHFKQATHIPILEEDYLKQEMRTTYNEELLTEELQAIIHSC